MGRESKSIQLNRLTLLSEKMSEGLSYNECYEWYYNEFNKSKSLFGKDRTAVYKMWKDELTLTIDEDKIQLLKNIEADRFLARSMGNAGAALAANKLVAQIKGILNKSGETIINVNNQHNTVTNNNVDVTSYSTEELIKLKEILNK